MKLIIKMLIDFINYLYKKYSFYLIDDFYFYPLDKSRFDSTLYILRKVLSNEKCVYSMYHLEHSFIMEDADGEFAGKIGIVT